MYRKREQKKKIKFIVLISLAVVLILTSIVFLSDNRRLNVLEKGAKDCITLVGNIVMSPINFIKNKISDSNNKKKLLDEYQQLDEKARQYDSLVAEKEELEKEIEELKKVVEVNNLLSDKVAMNAVVISRNVGYWYDTITVNKGSHDGVVEGMPVVVNDGIIGKIIKVSNFNSTVKLLTSSTSDTISVKIQNGEQYVYGLLTSYDSSKNLYTIEGISQTVEIYNDSLVTTTGMGDIFPSGIVVGTVKGSKSDNYDLARIVEVEPSVDFNSFSLVTILKRNVDQ